MSAPHSSHPPFKEVEASRPGWDADREVTFTQVHDPQWKPGDGAVASNLAGADPKGDVHQIVPSELAPAQAYKLLINGVTPRPIAFLSTQDKEGHRNLAPFSYFNAISSDPPVLAISIIGKKDSFKNIEETKRFVVNIISESFIEAANYTSIDSPAEVDEWKLSGLTPVPSSWTDTPGPPRVGESAYALECELYDSINFHSDRDPSRQTANLVLGRITKFVIKKSVLNPDNSIDLDKLRPVGRAGGITYVRSLDAFETPRPVWQEEKERLEVQHALNQGSQ